MEKTVLYRVSMAKTINYNPVTLKQSLNRQISRDQFCASVLHFNNRYYSLTDKKTITGVPADMSIHWKTGNIFFTSLSSENNLSLQLLHLSGEFQTIKVAGQGQTTCVDNRNDIVYLGTNNGVYKYKNDKSIEFYTAFGEDVMYIAVTNDGSTMFIATWPQNQVHIITNDGKKMELFSEIPNGHGLMVDLKNNIYFIVTKTSYILKAGCSRPIKITGLPDDKMTGVFVSKSNDVFAMDENSNLYLINPAKVSAKFLGCFKVNEVNSFAIDSTGNILIGVNGAIIKFDTYKEHPCTEKKLYSKHF